MIEYVGGFIDKAGKEWQRSEGNTKLPKIDPKYFNPTMHDEKQNVYRKTGAQQNEYGTPSAPTD